MGRLVPSARELARLGPRSGLPRLHLGELLLWEVVVLHRQPAAPHSVAGGVSPVSAMSLPKVLSVARSSALWDSDQWHNSSRLDLEQQRSSLLGLGQWRSSRLGLEQQRNSPLGLGQQRSSLLGLGQRRSNPLGLGQQRSSPLDSRQRVTALCFRCVNSNTHPRTDCAESCNGTWRVRWEPRAKYA